MARDISFEAAWNTNLSQKLLQLWSTRESADVDIHVGSKVIPAHKLVIGINSDILELGDTVNNPVNNPNNGNIGVYLDQEFHENTDLIENIIKSFYTGSIALENDDLKLTYKFATDFTIHWLLEYVLKRFQDVLNEKTFLDMYQFANMVGCETLQIMCLEYMDLNVANTLIESGDLMEMDFHCINRFTLVDDSALSEIKIFEMISKWFEHDVDNRKCHIESLLCNIRFQLIHKDDLDPIQNWIINTKGIDDKVRFQLLTKILNKERNDASSQKSTANRTVRRHDVTVSELLQILTDFIAKKGTAEQNTREPLSSEQFTTIVRERFSKSDPYTKHCILEYLSDNKYTLLCPSLTDLTNLPEFETSDELTRLIKKATNYHEYIEHVRCEELSYDALYKFMSKTVNWSNHLSWVHGTVGIIEWGRSHPEQVTKIPQLMAAAVCVCAMPDQYKDMILLPYLRELLQDEVYELVCRVHAGEQVQADTRRSGTTACQVTLLSDEIYLLQNNANIRVIRNENAYLGIDTTTKPALRVQARSGNPSRWLGTTTRKFILFDKQQCMERYPRFTLCNLSLIELRKLFIKYKHLHVMTFI